jgi:hypothetical protein
MADKVTSPLWVALNTLHAAVQKDLGVVSGALKDADTRMAGGKGACWVGPTARTWGSDLSGAANDVSRQATEFAAYVQRELARQPKEVTQQVADSERRQLSGRLLR